MTLHCAGRLGALSYLYEQRHQIAFSLGLTAEKVIAMCKGDYQQSLVIVTEDNNEEKRSPVPTTTEINLFFAVIESGIPSGIRFELSVSGTGYHSASYTSPPGDIFHPPLV